MGNYTYGLHQKSAIHYAADTKEKHFFPENRQESPRVNAKIPSNTQIKEPEIRKELLDHSTKSTDPVSLILTSQKKTINSYLDDWIDTYTEDQLSKEPPRQDTES
ncbi:hypothetical protein ElyMa_004906700 [Elysia marginata]|uniref:Uncharacterized protein n=1 Tax=Elysia marginata TaxID=1093978 RepID=A0AAV4IV50_9GAST|nr:hypothetical protein ElyMa_004906700 [Elysia marginata]